MELPKEYFEEKFSQLVTKDDLANRLTNFATNDDLLELATKNDLRAIRDDIAEVKALVQTIDRRTDEDTRALGHDVTELKRRVTALEH